MKRPICIGCGCDEQHACAIHYFNGLMEQHLGCWWVRFDAASRTGVCSACWDLVKAWDTAKSRAPIRSLIAERFYRQVLFLYEDKADALKWLVLPQRLLGGQSPRQLILDGELERVQALLDQIRDGAFV